MYLREIRLFHCFLLIGVCGGFGTWSFRLSELLISFRHLRCPISQRFAASVGLIVVIEVLDVSILPSLDRRNSHRRCVPFVSQNAGPKCRSTFFCRLVDSIFILQIECYLSKTTNPWLNLAIEDWLDLSWNLETFLDALQTGASLFAGLPT